MDATTTVVRPVTPAAPYIGGKRNLARRLCALIDSIPHRTYIEPFVGMGGIFFRRSQRPTLEVINDISGDVATLYRVLQEHYPYFVDMLRWRVTSRAEFQRLLALPGERLTDLNRAARFLYLQRLAFGGKVTGRNFGITPNSAARFNVTKLEPILADLNERLAGVVIEQLPYQELIRRYDREDALFYLDPPYWGNEADYGAGTFKRADFERLAELLAEIRGRFVLSLNDTPGAREVFRRFTVEEVATTYSFASKVNGAKRVGELIIRGR
jgi:DNA adenine methylase